MYYKAAVIFSLRYLQEFLDKINENQYDVFRLIQGKNDVYTLIYIKRKKSAREFKIIYEYEHFLDVSYFKAFIAKVNEEKYKIIDITESSQGEYTVIYTRNLRGTDEIHYFCEERSFVDDVDLTIFLETAKQENIKIITVIQNRRGVYNVYYEK